MSERGAREHTEGHLVETLSSLEQAVNYRNWLLELARPYLCGPILEVGAGRGTFTAMLAESGPVTAVEPGETIAALLRNSVGDDDRVTVVSGTVVDVAVDPPHGSAVMFNVLEHIEDDVEALRQIGKRLQPGAHLVIWVPAFEILFSDFDRKIGHHRRYRKAGLKSVATSAGYSVVKVHYANAPGWLSWMIFCRLLRAAPSDGAAPRFYDRFVLPAVRRVERVVKPPFGQSVLLVAKWPG